MCYLDRGRYGLAENQGPSKAATIAQTVNRRTMDVRM
jgi:hypothetical protein